LTWRRPCTERDVLDVCVCVCVRVCSGCYGARRVGPGAGDGSDEVDWSTHQHHQPARLLHAKRSVA